jgi:uncharacterized membrane protein
MFFDPQNPPPSAAPEPVALPSAPKVFVWVRNKFLAGLAVIIPIIVTYWILQSGYHFLHDFGQPVLVTVAVQINRIAGSQVVNPTGPAFKQLTQFVGILIPVLFLIGLGAMASNVIGARVVETVDRLMTRIPLISSIYKSLKQVIDAFRNLGGKQGFKRVVYVDYPVTGIWMLGFVTGQFYDKLRQRMMTAVFLPCAPSPMTGLLVVVEPDKITDAPLSVEDAMKMILSGGLIVPEHAQSTKVPLPPITAPIPTIPQGETLYADIPKADDTVTTLVPRPQTTPSIAKNLQQRLPDGLVTGVTAKLRTLPWFNKLVKRK